MTLLFLRLGLTAFGGPAAHIAMFRDETVERRKWVADQHFLDLLDATNLIPGPNSTEMAIHLGFVRAGWAGLIAAGASFIVPAMLIVMTLAWAYVRFGSTPEAGWLLYGIKPVVIAIIAQALWGLGRKAVKGPLTAAVGLAVLVLYFPLGGLSLPALAAVPFSLPLMFLTFLKIGAVLYGSGYVLLAFLRADFVVRLGWLTDQQLVDAIAIGQLTPWAAERSMAIKN